MKDLLDTSSQNQGNNYIGGTLPNATAVLVLGIVSIVGCFLWGIPGLACGIISLVLFRKDKMIYLSDPERYRESFQMSNAGFICGIIGTSMSGICVLLILLSLVSGGGFNYRYSF
jgi:hypothetical protein